MGTAGAVLAAGIGSGVRALSLIWILARSGDLNVRQAIFCPLGITLLAIGVFFVLMPVNECLALTLSIAAIFSGTFLFGGLTEDEWYLITSLKKNGHHLIKEYSSGWSLLVGAVPGCTSFGYSLSSGNFHYISIYIKSRNTYQRPSKKKYKF
jgi:hypothetical protein